MQLSAQNGKRVLSQVYAFIESKCTTVDAFGQSYPVLGFGQIIASVGSPKPPGREGGVHGARYKLGLGNEVFAYGLSKVPI
jgi:hypothetical protein